MSGLPDPNPDLPNVYQHIPAAGKLRLYPIIGDLMAPTLNRGDFCLVAPVDRYVHEGMYVIDGPFGSAVYRVERCIAANPKPYRLIPENTRYEIQCISAEDFDRDVLAMVIVTMNVRERRFLPPELRH